MKKQLSVARAVEAAGILFELNSGRQGVLAMAEQAGLSCASPDAEKKLLREWYAFVHAAVLYGLMVQAPNIVVVEYLRGTQDILAGLGLRLMRRRPLWTTPSAPMWTLWFVLARRNAPGFSSAACPARK